MNGVCDRCETPLAGRLYTVTLAEVAESRGTRLEYTVCKHCWQRLREQVRAGRVPA